LGTMQLTKVGRTGRSVSRVCLGTATFGKQTDEAESRRILDAAADARINFFDTADFYPMGRARSSVARKRSPDAGSKASATRRQRLRFNLHATNVASLLAKAMKASSHSLLLVPLSAAFSFSWPTFSPLHARAATVPRARCCSGRPIPCEFESCVLKIAVVVRTRAERPASSITITEPDVQSYFINGMFAAFHHDSCLFHPEIFHRTHR